MKKATAEGKRRKTSRPARKPRGKRAAPSRKAIFVLGMHRSGTSALAGLMRRLGADGPATPLGPSAHNPKGHFESRPLYRLQDELLQSAGSSWDDFRPVPETWTTSPKADEFRGRLAGLIESEYGQSGFFVVKDPRNCRLVGLWREVLAEMRVQPLFVHIHRNPLEVARSLGKRDGLDAGYGALVWLRHLLDAEAGSRGQTRSFTSYDRLLGDWPAEMEKIAGDLKISWPTFAPSHAADLDAMVLPELKHNSAGALLGSRLSARWIGSTHDVFERWSRSGEDAADHAVLDGIRRAFDASAEVFGATVHARGEALTTELDRARATIAAAEERAREATAAAEDQAGERAAAIAALTEERDKACEAQATVEARHLARTQAQEEAHEDAMRNLRAERDALADRLSSSESALAQRAAEIEDALRDLRAAEDALAASEARSAEADLEQTEAADRERMEAADRIRDLETAIERRDEDLARMQVLMLEAGTDPAPRAPAGADGKADAPTRLRRQSLRRSEPSPLAPEGSRGRNGAAPDRRTIDDLIAQRNKARAAQEHAEFRNQAFLNSTSWRLTAPIRWLALRLKR